MDKLNGVPLLFLAVLLGFAGGACRFEPPYPARMVFNNETSQEIEVELVSGGDEGGRHKRVLRPDVAPDKEPRNESGSSEDTAGFVWPREEGSANRISEDIQSVTVRTERGCVFNLKTDQLEQWADGPDHQFWIDLTPERMACPDESDGE